MFGRIVVPLDGSRFAQTALPIARAIARSARARLDLLLVHTPVPDWGGDGEPVIRDSERIHREQEYLAEITDQIAPDREVAVGWTLLHGRPAEELVEHVRSAGTDLLVMATHGRGPLSRLWLGSVADHLVRHLTVPVLLVRPDPGFAWKPAPVPPRMRSMLVPLDGSPASIAIFPHAVHMARLLRAHVTLVHVVEPGPSAGALPVPYPVSADASTVAQRQANAQHWLDREAERFRAYGISVSSRVVVGTPVARTLLELAGATRSDLIACTTQGGAMRRLVLGSVADKLVRGSLVPVLVVPPPVAQGLGWTATDPARAGVEVPAGRGP